MGELLWGKAANPVVDDFVDAQLIFVEDGGLGSRVGRRYDAHVTAPAGADCRDAPEASPDYCVGPVQILPLINADFDAGIRGEGHVLEHSVRLQASLLWFFYVSTYKESRTCFAAAKDCDSSWAYFGAGDTMDADAVGLGGVIKAIAPEAYGPIFEALLAVRCWRDLDSGDVAEDAALFEQATAQLDTALDYGYSQIILFELQLAAAQTWSALQILGPSFDRAARAIDPAAADRLAAFWASDGSDLAARTAAAADLEALFPCP